MADLTITYKGSDIVELSDSATKTLKTGGTYCEDDIDVAYVKPSGGTQLENYIVYSDLVNGVATRWELHGESLPNYMFYYFNYYGVTGAPITLAFSEETTSIGNAFLQDGGAILDTTNAKNIEYIGGSFALASRYSNIIDGSQSVINFPKYTGYKNSVKDATSDNLFRAANNYAPKTYIFPLIEKIPTYAWYQATATGLDITLGSIGHAVQATDLQPFGGTTSATGTVTIYTTGALLDTISTAVMNNSGSGLSFIFKASESTTYGGNSYSAGDTMLTSTGA